MRLTVPVIAAGGRTFRQEHPKMGFATPSVHRAADHILSIVHID